MDFKAREQTDLDMQELLTLQLEELRASPPPCVRQIGDIEIPIIGVVDGRIVATGGIGPPWQIKLTVHIDQPEKGGSNLITCQQCCPVHYVALVVPYCLATSFVLWRGRHPRGRQRGLSSMSTLPCRLCITICPYNNRGCAGCAGCVNASSTCLHASSTCLHACRLACSE